MVVVNTTNSASDLVYFGIMRDLEEHRLVPGQRLVETELSLRYSVGRNAVREAVQRLAVRGVVDLFRNKSAAIRMLDLAEAFEVLDVAAVMTGLMARTAAKNFDPVRDSSDLQSALDGLTPTDDERLRGEFSKARRRFYRTILAIGGNRELHRLFPAVGMHIIYSQYQSPRLDEIRMSDYRSIRDAIVARDPAAAHAAGTAHVEHVRATIRQIAATRPGLRATSRG